MAGGVEVARLVTVVDQDHKAARQPFPAAERRGLRVYRHALSRGVLLRPLGDVVYFMPPYVVTPEEIDRMIEAAAAAIEHAVS